MVEILGLPENVGRKQEFKASIYNDTVDAIDSLGSYFNIPHVSKGDFIYGSYFKKIELYLEDWDLKTNQCNWCNASCDSCDGCEVSCDGCEVCVSCQGCQSCQGCNSCLGCEATCDTCQGCNYCDTCQSDNPEG